MKMRNFWKRNPWLAGVVAFVFVGAVPLAWSATGADGILSNAIRTRHIRDAEITGPKLAAGAVGLAAVADDSLGFTKFLDTLPLDAATAIQLGALNGTIYQDSTGRVRLTTNNTSFTTITSATTSSNVTATVPNYAGTFLIQIGRAHV